MKRQVWQNVEYNRIIPNSITEKELLLPDLLLKDHLYEQGLVFTIDVEGRDHRELSRDSYLRNRFGRTTKVEGIERLNKDLWNFCNIIVNGPQRAQGPFSCHLFIANEDDPSFPDHTDPDGVFLYVVKGQKTMVVDGKIYTLEKDQTLYIPPGTPHHAVNYQASVMLSIGFDNFLVEKF